MAQRRGERMKEQLVIVGNPSCRRVAFWKAAAARTGWAAARVVPYSRLVNEPALLAESVTPEAVIRFETAADYWETFKLLLKHGADAAAREGYDALDAAQVDRLEYDRGWLVKPRQAYLGFTRLLGELDRWSAGAARMNTASDISLFFDKVRCQERLGDAGLSAPHSFGQGAHYDQIRSWCRAAGRIMVKLAHGSGAAGCIALHSVNGCVRGLTTVAEVSVRGEKRKYCSKRVRHLLDEIEIAALVNDLCAEKVQVEKWLPKAACQGYNVDVRVVCIGGLPRHTVARASRSIFTNLTLGNRRGDLAELKRRMGPDAWHDLATTCVLAAREFPDTHTLGIDVLVRPDYKRHAILEINAFGDLLLNELDQGEDTYTAALRSW
jgi:glutathione synthase/RimK-type ligase-like ATP-grasp enzyme